MKVLIVEDQKKIADALRKGLEQESFAVDVAYNGDDGLSEITHEEYDIIILDRMLPGEIDGTGIIRTMRESGNATPVIFLTAKASLSHRIEGLNAGADDYLVKPFSFDELLARIKALLRRPREAVGTVLSYDTLTLDTISYDVKRGSEKINLSLKEFSLLEYMMRNPEQVLTKESIMSHVWDFDSDILPNTVEVYIGYLRKKIDKPFQNQAQLIQTVRGFGYKLEAKSI